MNREITNETTYTPEEAGRLLEEAHANSPNAVRDLVNELLESGELNENSTFGDLDAAIKRRTVQQ